MGNLEWLYFVALGLAILLIVLLVLLRPKKVKPIDLEAIEEDEKSDLEQVIEAIETTTETRPLTTFEQEQEANAIISYQELVEAVKKKKGLVDPSEEEQASPLEIEELPLELIEEKPKFKNSEFISPVFGKDNYNDNDDFLKELKDFRKNL